MSGLNYCAKLVFEERVKFLDCEKVEVIMMEYRIIRGELDSVVETVRRAIVDGWEPTGGLACGGKANQWGQAMIRLSRFR